jgi:hypothetical protein
VFTICGWVLLFVGTHADEDEVVAAYRVSHSKAPRCAFGKSARFVEVNAGEYVH